MTRPTSATISRLTSMLSSADYALSALLIAIAALILATGITIAIVWTAKQGRADVRINIHLGRDHRRPP